MSDDPIGTGISTLALVEIITDSYCVTGNCRGLNERLRLIDLLSNPEIRHLQLTDIKVRQYPTSAEIIATEGPLFIDKKSVILGRSLASAEDEERRNDAHRFEYVEKARQRMLVFAPPFRIAGDIHVVKEADLASVLPKLFETFAAMTDAVVVRDGDNGPGWSDGFVLVNGQRVDMVCVVPSEYGAGLAGTDAVEEGVPSDKPAVGHVIDEAPAA